MFVGIVVWMMAVCDIKYGIVPDRLQIILLIYGLFHTTLAQFVYSSTLFGLLYVYNGLRPQQIGGADIKLISILALILPIHRLPHLLCLAAFIGLAQVFFSKKESIPFVPALAISTTLLLIH